MQTRSGLLTRTGTRLTVVLAVLIATAGLMLAGGATPALADGTTTYSFAFATTSFGEGSGAVAVNVTRSGSLAGTDVVSCSQTGGTATLGTDYTFATQSLTFAPTETTKICAMTITQDAVVEGAETVVLSLTATSGFLGGGVTPTSMTITINDDEPSTIQWTATNFNVTEGNAGTSLVTISATRTGNLTAAASVPWATTDGTATTASGDYLAGAGTFSWIASEGGTKTAMVTINGDTTPETDETINLNFGTPTGAVISGASSATVTIVNDDSTVLPVITALTPAFGPIGGSNAITITGTNLSGTSLVTFGTSTAAPFSVSATSVMVVVPFSSTFAGQTVQVLITTPAGTSVADASTANDYTYTGGPTITALSTSTGPTTGSTFVTITGTGFTLSGMTVTFGGTTATFAYVSATSISAVSPAHTAGVFNVVVTTAAGTSLDTTADDFTYTGTSIPTVTLVNPASGPVGTSVTVTGTGFTGATSVTVGGVSAGFTFVSDSSITVTIPVGTPAGVVSILVTNASGTSLNVAADNFNNTSTSGATTTYTLYFRWSLISWSGIDNLSASNAVKGIETGTANPATNDVSGSVTAIWYFDGPSQTFKGYFVGFDNTPGANDFTVLVRGRSYWIAISTSGSVAWTVLQGS